MRILVLGGTIFLGRHLVERALARGHTVTLFNRGQHNPDLFPAVARLYGDRTRDLSALAGHRWDAVIDTGGYHPRDVRRVAEQLTGQTDHYTFVSSLSVYPEETAPGADEEAPVQPLAGDPEATEVTGETYGPLKALCEQAAEEALPGHVLTVRPGLIVGPWDPSDRFTYWPVRIQRGGAVLAPGEATDPVQFIDVRDLAGWMLQMIEAGQTGIYNATGPEQPLARGTLLETCRTVTGSDATFTWVDEAFLLEQAVAPYTAMPLWVPSVYAGFDRFAIGKALAAGLHCRPLAETVADTLAWHETRPPGAILCAGLTAQREQELLATWRDRQA